MSRSKWKGPYICTEDLKKLNDLRKQHKAFLVASRNSEIIPKFIGLSFHVHNGKKYDEVCVTEDMMGHKFGEFSFTRAKFSFKKKKTKK
jgi:small subunit ribosomal protein S19